MVRNCSSGSEWAIPVFFYLLDHCFIRLIGNALMVVQAFVQGHGKQSSHVYVLLNTWSLERVAREISKVYSFLPHLQAVAVR